MPWWTAWLWRQLAYGWKTSRPVIRPTQTVAALGRHERAVGAVVEDDEGAQEEARGRDRERQRPARGGRRPAGTWRPSARRRRPPRSAGRGSPAGPEGRSKLDDRVAPVRPRLAVSAPAVNQPCPALTSASCVWIETPTQRAAGRPFIPAHLKLPRSDCYRREHVQTSKISLTSPAATRVDAVDLARDRRRGSATEPLPWTSRETATWSPGSSPRSTFTSATLKSREVQVSSTLRRMPRPSS